MSLPITEQTKGLLENQVKSPELVLEIDGLPIIGSSQVGTYARYGDPIAYGDEGLVYGGIFQDPDSLPYIDLANSTNTITQQLLIDQGGTSSATSFDVVLIDKNQRLTEIISPGFVIEDILGRKAKLYMAFEGGGHPRDSILFFNGIVAGVKAGAGNIRINLASPEKLKNLDIFPKVTTTLSAGINNSVTTIPVVSTEGFSLPADAGTLRTYLQIGDEIIEYTGKTVNSFTGCVRGARGTTATTHNINDNVEIRYGLTGNLRDLCLKLMLSGINEPYVSDLEIVGINYNGLDTVQNAVFVARDDFKRFYGATAGDLITIAGDSIPANNGTFTVLDIVESTIGSYILVDANLSTNGSGALISLTSKYAVLPKFCGLEMTPDQVDVEEFELKYDQFSAQFFEYDFFIDEQVNGSEFINKEILFPSGCYALPRKAKTSLGVTIPPLAAFETKKFDLDNVTNSAQLKIDRSISKNFFNAIVIKYDKLDNSDRFLRGTIRQSADSTNRIKIANKPMVIEAAGVRAETEFDAKFSTLQRRLLERYQYGAESIDVDTQLGTGFDVEIGDTVIFQGKELQVSDSTQGSRSFLPRLFEVQNKTLSLKGNAVRFSLVDTAFNLDGRYGVISPSSIIDAGSTNISLNLKRSFGTTVRNTSEQFKWRNLIGATLRIRSEDYSFDEYKILAGLDPSNINGILLDSTLSMAPSENYIVDVTTYPTSAGPELDALIKRSYVFWNNQAEVLTGISSSQFTVDVAWLPDLAVGYRVYLHDETYNYQSDDLVITDITGTTITVDGDLGFTPVAGDKIEILGWPDGGAGYLWL
ncbi:MAG TPA: hypothetical protein V6C58_24580 [Allocoleopsis sp.]